MILPNPKHKVGKEITAGWTIDDIKHRGKITDIRWHHGWQYKVEFDKLYCNDWYWYSESEVSKGWVERW